VFLFKRLHEGLEVLLQLDPHEFGLRNANLLPVEATLQLPRDVHVIIFDDPQNDIRRANTLRALRRLEFTSLLYLVVDVLTTRRAIGSIVMRHVVNIVLLKEIQSYHPGARADDLIHPFAMHQDLAPLMLVHHNLAFLLDGLLVARHTND
jgi:hypothetical protein